MSLRWSIRRESELKLELKSCCGDDEKICRIDRENEREFIDYMGGFMYYSAVRQVG